ncbi:MAG: Unknown protein [uncultured Sulfurovum sp.]|uniref:Uncharacterized protein n=1 Tax=uncultured Sulfurovum sp. TaxID=269237 RepID=A0A6S6SYE7_9BACT|nr:MAG: Unknown protein [uncultured Sulfurovum sp.]
MGQIKKNMMKEDETLKGSDERVALLGGFLDIQIDEDTICTVSIPIPNYLADRDRDSVSEWYEEFKDLEGNNYSALVWSSMYGVEWKIELEKRDNIEEYKTILDDILERIKIDINYTEEA